ncbi:MAG: vWA domain-containing protein, partial [Planctomycetota bacterium]
DDDDDDDDDNRTSGGRSSGSSGSGGSGSGGGGGSGGSGSGSGSGGSNGGGSNGGGGSSGSNSGGSGNQGSNSGGGGNGAGAGNSGGSSSGGKGSGGNGNSSSGDRNRRPRPKPPIGAAPSVRGVQQIATLWRDRAAAIASTRLGVSASYGLTTQLYGAEASGPGLPRVGGMYGRYDAWLPPSQDGDRIDQFNNPNPVSFPSADAELPKNLRNYFGYLTYVQFLMDHGRDLRPDNANYVELSVDSPFCPRHTESVAGRSFSFPPREMPMHAVRRAAIAAVDVLEDRNRGIPSTAYRDHVSLVTFDTTDGSMVRQELTPDYTAAMRAFTDLQAVGDKGTTTATESGLVLAKQMLLRPDEGGRARETSTRIVVLLTDGMPNAYESPDAQVEAFATGAGSDESYGGGLLWLDAALMQAQALEADKIDVYPAGVGMGADNRFMDRMARLGGTAGSDGRAPRGSGNPARYERVLRDMFEQIISIPTARMVQ